MGIKTRLLTPGPTPLPEETRLALAKDMIHHRKSDFHRIMEDVQGKLKILFGTKQDVLTIASSGTGAMTAAVYSLFKPGERVLVIEAGKFGQRWREIALSRDLQVESIKVEWGHAVEPHQIEAALEKDDNISGVLIQACETSTGALNPIHEIGDLLRNKEVLFIVDGISAVGISPCPMDAWSIDCLLTGSQKGLMLPPGLSLLALSDSAWKKAEQTRPGCFYFDLPKERAKLVKGETNFTSPINLIMGLQASLNLILASGLDSIYQGQWAMTTLIRQGIIAMGLEPFVQSDFAWGITSVLMPKGINGQEILKLCKDEYGVIMAGGQDHLKGQIIRIGHMGWVDWGDCMAGLNALACALERFDYTVHKDFARSAMQAWQASSSFPSL